MRTEMVEDLTWIDVHAADDSALSAPYWGAKKGSGAFASSPVGQRITTDIQPDDARAG